MPRVGFGTAGLGGATEEATSWALASGYRLLDSAQVGGPFAALSIFPGTRFLLDIRIISRCNSLCNGLTPLCAGHALT